VEVCAVTLLKVSEDEEKLHVGLVALEGAVVTAQVSATVPVNELPGVTVMVEVPEVEPELMVMAPLLVSEKLVLLLPPGAWQKSPQPDRIAAAANNPAQRPIFIAAPLAPYSAACSQVTASPRILSRCRTVARARQAHYGSRRNPAGIRLSVASGRQP